MSKESDTESLDFSLIIASAVHDMKNSLGMLLQSVDSLCDDLPDQLQENANTVTIKYEAERVNNYLIHLLGLYRIQNDRLTLNIDEYFLPDLFDEQKAQFGAVLAARGIQFETECDEFLSWYFDREIILGIINNALNNASRYTEKKIMLVAEERENCLVMEIHDDGPGYPEWMLNADPSQINNNINFKTGSTSLGLYFASEVAKLHKQKGVKGRISLSNGGRLGGGVFAVYLP